MNYSDPKTKDEADMLIIRKDVKVLLRSFEERDATVEELNIAINLLNQAAGKLGCSAAVKADCLDSIDIPPFRSLLGSIFHGNT